MQQLTVTELKARLDEGERAPIILDIREPWELGVCRLEPCLAIPMGQVPARLGELDPDSDIAVLCHHGVRSRHVTGFLLRQGYSRVFNVLGGIDAWAREVDPAMATYFEPGPAAQGMAPPSPVAGRGRVPDPRGQAPGRRFPRQAHPGAHRRHAVTGLGWLLAALLAAPAWGLDLQQAYRLAREQDPTFARARADYEAVRYQRRQALAGLLPSLEARATRNRNRDEVTAPGVSFVTEGSASYYSNEYALDFSQTVFNVAQLARLREQHYRLRAAQARLQAAHQDLILRLVQAYLGVLAAQDNLELARAERQAIQEQLELAKARLAVGLGTVTDQYEARARYLLAEAAVVEAENTLADRRQALAEIIGRTPSELASMDPAHRLLPPDPAAVSGWLVRAEQRNPELLAARLDRQAERWALRAARSGHLPTLDLVASRNRVEADGSLSGPGLTRDNTDLGVELRLPLFAGGLVLAQAGEARARWRAAWQTQEQTLRAVRRRVRAAFRDLTGGIRRAAALESAVTASESALTGKREGFEAGTESNVDVLNAQRDLFRARRDHLEARYGYLVNRARLLAAAGLLNEKDVATFNAWLYEGRPD